MNGNSLLKKTLVFGIIVLFIGIAVAPGITAVDLKGNSIFARPSFERQNNELVEITVQLCKPDGVENHTIMLTQQQANDLDNLIESFKIQLDAAETIGEIVTLYYEMIISLDNLDLIPEGESISEIQELVTKNAEIRNEQINNEFNNPLDIEKYVNQEIQSSYADNDSLTFDFDAVSNAFCLFSGRTTNTIFISLSTVIRFLSMFYSSYIILAMLYYSNLFRTILESLGIDLEDYISDLVFFAEMGSLILSFILPFDFLMAISFGFIYNPASGWVHTAGLKGIKRWEGNGLYGDAAGFIGIKIYSLNLNAFYLGYLLFINFENEPQNINHYSHI